jgi:ribonuclease D
MTVRLHRGDLPDLTRYTDSVAIDTETMGLHPHRDRLCVVQMSNGDGSADVVQIPRDHGKGQADAPNLKALLTNPKVTKIFHFARFDLAALYNTFGVMPQPVYCTKVASRLGRTYTDRHGLKDLHALRERLDAMLVREGRTGLAQACFEFLPTRAKLDLQGWDAEDIFAHS